MIDAADVDFNSSWARMPAILGPMAGASLSDDEGVPDKHAESEMLPEQQDDASDKCNYCRNLTWTKISGLIPKRAGMTFKPTYGDMLRRADQCSLCRILTKCVEEANPSVELDKAYKIALTPIGRDRKHKHSGIFALAVNPVFASKRRQQEARESAQVVEAGTLAVFVDEDYDAENDNRSSTNDTNAVDPQVYQRIAGRRVRPAADMRTLKGWFNKCRREHTRCKDPSLYRTHSMSFANDRSPRKVLPSRTVFVPEDGSSGLVYLQEHDGIEREDYVALSYCWGTGATMVRTLNDTREKFMQGIEVASLPKTFRDAIDITRQLGVRHLWIDSLCIIQDDKGDWAHEANLMGRLYAGSLLTIAALSSASADGGLFFDRQLHREVCSLPFGSPDDNETHKNKAKGDSDNLDNSNTEAESNPDETKPPRHAPAIVYLQSIPSLNEKPVQLEEEAHSKRAWTLQERLLSPRVVHCAHRQYYWECREMKSVEDGSVFPEGIMMMPKQRPGSLIGSLAAAQAPRDALDLWYEVVRTYSWRRMTFQHDKLTALDGLVKTFAPNVNARYFDGIWATDLSQALAWRRSRRCPALTKPDVPRAASWSWASVDGGLNYLNQRVYYHRPVPAWKNLLWKPEYLQGHCTTVIRVTAWVLIDHAARTAVDLLRVCADIFLDDGADPSSERPETQLSCVALAEPTSEPRRAHVLLLSYNDVDQTFTRFGLADVRDFLPLKKRLEKRLISLV